MPDFSTDLNSPGPTRIIPASDLADLGTATFAGILPPAEQLTGLADHPATIGRYRIESELGRGGLGVVYRGYDPDLKRPVAVKMILAGRFAGPEVGLRFRNEAEAVARLDHPNIIRIYEVGTDAGRPFLALELVDGPNLALALAAAPLPPTIAAKLLEAIARAVAHAHEVGIVHRDLKPANILLQTDDRLSAIAETVIGSTAFSNAYRSSYRPKVADFGLAKQLESESELTATGALVGTPTYMAPEQAGGDQSRVGPAADVWALGAILYECLTGRPPFRGVTPFETISLARTTDPASPTLIQPGVPRDLAVIALKCLEKSPERRYASATALAEDLARFLAGKPIVARPVGPIVRWAKWARRHPAPAALALVSLTAIIAAIGGAIVHQIQLQAEIDLKIHEEQHARVAAEKAKAEKARADANYHKARETLRTMMNRLSDPKYAGVPRLLTLRKAQAEDALAYFQTVAALRDDPDPQVRYDAAKADIEAGGLAEALGQSERAHEAFARAHGVLARLVNEDPENRDYRFDRAFMIVKLTAFLPRAEMIPAMAVAVADLRAVTDPMRATPEQLGFLAGAINTLGTMLHLAGRFPEALPLFHEAYDRHTALLTISPNDLGLRRKVAENTLNLCEWYRQNHRSTEATRFYDETEASLRALIATDPDDRHATATLAILRTNWHYELRADHRYTEALALLDPIVSALDRLYRIEPDDDKCRDALYRLYGVRSELYSQLGRYSDAVKDGERVVILAPASNRRVHRWFMALTRFQAGHYANALNDLDGLRTEFPTSASAAEYSHGAVTAGTVANRLRALAALGGAAISPDLDRAEALAVRLLDALRTVSTPKDWATSALETLTDPAFAPLQYRSDLKAVLVPK